MKYWKNILDAIIVIAIIIGIYLINPGNIFKGRLKTHNTANNISAIREIGQLITAEYYGETISTMDQSQLQMISAEELNSRANLVFVELKQNLLSVYANKLKNEVTKEKENFWKFKWFRRAHRGKKEAVKKIQETLNIDNSIAKDSLYHAVLEYYWFVATKSTLKLQNNKEDDKALWLLYQEIIDKTENLTDKEFDDYMQKGLPQYTKGDFCEYYYDTKREDLSKKEKRKELSMIGRGWVKAGFNFDKLDENNFYFDKKQGIVHIFGVHPEILNADINPWFIPEKKIPGFQIIEANRHVDFYDVVKVKSYCVEKLRIMAINAGILQQAEIQGKEALKSFIGLLTDTEIKEVYFHYDSITVLSKEILNDQFISYEESKILDTLIAQQIDTILKLDKEKVNYTDNQKLKEIKTQQLKAIVSSLKKVFFEERNHYFNRLSMLVFKITADSILTHKELDELKTYRWDIEKTLFNKNNFLFQLKNNIWYSNNLDFINEFNDAVNEIQCLTLYYGDRHDTIYKKDDFKEIKEQCTDSIQISIKHYYTEVAYTYINNLFDPGSLIVLKYPINVDLNWQQLLDDKNNIRRADKRKSDKTHDTLFIGPKITYQIFGTYNTKIDSLSISKDQNYVWHIDSISIDDKNQLCFLEYCINYYKTHYTGFITKYHRRLTESLKPEKIRERAQAFRASF